MQETLPLCPRPALSGLLRAGERLAACAGLGDAEGAQALSARAAVLVAHGPDGPVGAMGGPGRAHGLGRGPPAVAAPAPRPACWTQIFIYGESRRIMPYIVVRSPRC
jgi:hypothetical protein